MGEVNVLVLESSTSSAKAMVYSSERGVLAVRTKGYENVGADVTRHDADSIFRQTAALGREVSEGYAIQAVALSGTWHSVMLAEEDGTPASQVYLWSNTEASDLCRRLREDED